MKLFFSSSIVSFSVLSSIALREMDVEKFENDQKELLLKYLSYTTNDYEAKDGAPQQLHVIGSAACDSIAVMYAKLLELINIDVQVRAIRWPDGTSKHTIPIFLNKSHHSLKGNEKFWDNIYLYDPYFKFILRDSNNQKIPISRLCKLDSKDLSSLNAESQYFAFQMHRDKYGLKFLCQNTNEEDVFYTNRINDSLNIILMYAIKITNALPKSFLKFIYKIIYTVDFYNKKIFSKLILRSPALWFPLESIYGEMNYADFSLFINARLDHIFLDLNQARKGYEKILATKSQDVYTYNADEFMKQLDVLETFLKK